MSAFAQLAGNDLRTLYRSGYIWVSLAVFGLMLLVALQASRLDFAGYEAFIAAVILFDVVLSPLMLVGLMVLLERGEGAFAVMCVSPVPMPAYIAARVLTVSLISLAQTLVIVLVVYDGTFSPVALIAGLAGAASLSALFGFVVIAYFDDLYAYLFPMIGAIMALGVPGYGVLLGIAPEWLSWHPTAGALALIEATFSPNGLQEPVTASASLAGWILAAGSLAYLAVRRMRTRIGGAS